MPLKMTQADLGLGSLNIWGFSACVSHLFLITEWISCFKFVLLIALNLFLLSEISRR